MPPKTGHIRKYKCTSCGSFYEGEDPGMSPCPVCGDEAEDLWVECEINLDRFKRSAPRPDIEAANVEAPHMTEPSPEGFVGSKQITITSAYPDAVIYYTLDGSAPSKKSTRYKSPFYISKGTTVKAIVYLGWRHSRVVTHIYRKSNESAEPSIMPSGGSYDEPIDVTLINNWPGSQLYYSINDAPPLPYRSPIHIHKNCTLKAYAVKDGETSEVKRANYYIRSTLPATYDKSLWDRFCDMDASIQLFVYAFLILLYLFITFGKIFSSSVKSVFG